jgi:hypothetical protein
VIKEADPQLLTIPLDQCRFPTSAQNERFGTCAQRGSMRRVKAARCAFDDGILN